MAIRTVLLTGATGFIGRHAAAGLLGAGFIVRGATRDPERARRQMPWLDFVRCDLSSQKSIEAAMEHADAAVYLFHAIGTGRNYPEREAEAAVLFRNASEQQKLTRIVYLGGVRPDGPISRHLSSRLHTGQILRAGAVPTIELMASMVVGHQSQSFTLVRDLVVKCPWLVLPDWLDHRSCPIAICDVAAALTVALQIPLQRSQALALPGPECLSHRELLELLGAPFGTLIMKTRVPHVSPTLAGLALSVLSRVSSAVSHELVQGLIAELVPKEPSFWDQIGKPPLRPLRLAIADAFSDEIAEDIPSAETRQRIVEKSREWLRTSRSIA